MTGLTTEQVTQLQKEYGPNALPSKSQTSAIKIFVEQFKNVMSLLLIVAAVLSYFVGDPIDSILVVGILVLNAVLGFWQEYKAGRELEALKKMEVSFSRVIRDGKEQKISSDQLVPGDLILLESGDKVPADAKLVQSFEITVNESALTGESVPVEKTLEDPGNGIFMGTTIVTGRGQAVVSATGIHTKFGSIAQNLSTIEEEPSPLEISLTKLSKQVGALAIGVAILLFIIETLKGQAFAESFFTSTALMVAAVPEGLPAVITIVLAVGVRRMYLQKGLIRRMNAIESLGATSVICTDKTGTLTKNEMRVKEVTQKSAAELTDLLSNAVLCNSSSLVTKESGQEEVLGDTTEGALLLWAKDQQIDPVKVRSEGTLIEEKPFNTKDKMMSSLWHLSSGTVLYSKGAPEVILPLCDFTPEKIQELTNQYESLAAQGLRVLAFSQKKLASDKETIGNNLKGHQFLGFIGIADAAREEAKQAVLEAHQAGIKVVMITGDNELTARAIALEVGLIDSPEGEVITGKQLDTLSDADLVEKLKTVRVFARVMPEHKLKIVKALQSMGEVVGVTGDGVNDALALKQAEVGVAMGITGTEVAKEASDLVILDDNFATIIAAIKEGRLIYKNIIKIVRYLMAGNFAEILLILVAVLMGLPTPLLPAQILWINFVTDGFPALTLAMDGSNKNIMLEKPRNTKEGILNATTAKLILVGGAVLTIISIGVFYIFLQDTDVATARTMAFAAIVFAEIILAFVVRGTKNIFSNKYLLGASVAILVMQVLISTVPFLQQIFKTALDF